MEREGNTAITVGFPNHGRKKFSTLINYPKNQIHIQKEAYTLFYI